MKALLVSPESEKKIMREDVINSYKKFVERGIKNPDDLDLEDPEVRAANELFDKWREQEEKSAEAMKKIRNL